MGAGYVLECKTPFCRYRRFLSAGVGMRFPVVYQEVMEKARNGEFSEEHAQFLQDHPDGAINAETNIYQCRDCGYYFSGYDLGMYLPKGDNPDVPEKGRWSVAFPAEGMSYVSPYELKTRYKLYKAYPHHCPKCNGEAGITEEVKDVSEKCPKCGSDLKVSSVLWD